MARDLNPQPVKTATATPPATPKIYVVQLLKEYSVSLALDGETAPNPSITATLQGSDYPAPSGCHPSTGWQPPAESWFPVDSVTITANTTGGPSLNLKGPIATSWMRVMLSAQAGGTGTITTTLTAKGYAN